MVASVANFGAFYSASRILVACEPSDRPAVYSTTVGMMLVASFLVSIGLIGAYFVIGSFFDRSEPVLLAVAALSWTVLLQRTFQYMLRGSGRIADIAVQTVLPPVTMFVCYAALYWRGSESIGYLWALVIYGGAFCVTHVATSVRLRVRPLPDWHAHLTQLLQEQRKTGLPVYWGSLASVGASEAVVVVAGALSDPSEFGSYSLALSFAGPLVMIPSAMGTVRFVEGASQRRISASDLRFTVVLSFLVMVVFSAGMRYVFPVVYGGRYQATTAYAIVMAVGFLLHGFGDYLNQFLLSHGRGRELKYAAFVAGGVQVLFAVVLMPAFGIWGLVASRVLSSASYAVFLIWRYRHELGKN